MTAMFCVSDEDGNTKDYGERIEIYLYKDVWGWGSVTIKAEDEGIVVDIFPFHVVDEPVATVCVHMSDLVKEEE